MNSSAGWPTWIGLRYLGTRKDERFVSFIAGLSMSGIALGVAVLVVVLSVMNGFERELKERILDVTSHATLQGLDNTLDDWRGERERLAGFPGLAAAAPFVEGQALFVHGDRSSGAKLRGVDLAEESTVSALGRHVAGGIDVLRGDRYRIILGRALAGQLGVAVGDRVLVVVAQGTVTPAGVVPRMKHFTVAGLLDAGMYEYDRGLALIEIGDGQRLFRLDDPFAAPRVVRELALELGGGFYVSDWTKQQANFFRSIQVTKSILFVILLLVIGVAAFNIVSTLVMIVKGKQGDIAVLRTLGARPRDVLTIFVVQGAAIGLIGTVVGLALGLLLATNLTAIVRGIEGVFGITLVDPELYFIADLPATVDASDLLRVAGMALLLGVASTLYPAWRASRTQPADALRHEV